MKTPTQRLREIQIYCPEFSNDRLVRIEAKIQAIIEYLDEQAEKGEK